MGSGSVPEGMEPYLETLIALKSNETSLVVETTYGFHIIKRIPMQRIVVQHILITHDDGVVKPKEPRSRRDARKLIDQVREEALMKDSDFSALAQKYTEDPNAPDGVLAPFARGQMTPRFEQYAFALERGSVSGVVSTKFGYHIIRRLR